MPAFQKVLSRVDTNLRLPRKKRPKKKKSGKRSGDSSPCLPPLHPITLNKHITALQREMDKAESYRNHAQLERDKIEAFYGIIKKQLDETKAEVRNKDREMEEMQERKHVEIQVYRQKVKHLLYEHQNTVGNMKTNALAERNAEKKSCVHREKKLLEDLHNLKMKMREQELAHQQYIATMSAQHAKELEKVRKEYHLNLSEAKNAFKDKNTRLREDKDIEIKHNIHEIEERKNTHLRGLMGKHQKDYERMRFYYNDITHNTLDLIKSLKEDGARMKEKEAHNEKLMLEMATENKNLSEPLQEALKEVDILRQKMSNYDKDKADLKRTKYHLAKAETQLKNMEFEHDILQQRFEKLQEEREHMNKRFEGTVYDIQQRAGLKNILLEKKVETMRDAIELKDGQLEELKGALDPNRTEMVNHALDSVLRDKNSTINQLRFEVAKAAKAHNDLGLVYEAKMEEMGVRPEAFGFTPLIASVGKNPAGLVTAPPF